MAPTRRTVVKSLGAGAVLAALPVPLFAENGQILTRPIPSTDEALPVIGLGTSRTFDADQDQEWRGRLVEVLQVFFDQGGTLIDSSPMYKSAESVAGDLMPQIKGADKVFAATKVWSDGEQAGIDQMNTSFERMGVEVMDLMQIHNLRDWQVHLKTLRAMKDEGKIRYIGVTTSHGRNHDELAALMEAEDFDFVQFSYNIGNRTVEERLLPLAADRGMGVLVNRPYARGELFAKTKDKPLPDFAADIDAQSWGQFFLKFVLGHPAVTNIIPATSKAKHAIDNMGGGFGRVPDEAMRAEMIAYFETV